MQFNFLLRRNLVFIIFLFVSWLSAFSQINVRHVTSGTDLGTKQGIFYALPYTLIRVDLEVEKTEYIAGPYAEYAAKYLDLQDVNTSNYDEYVITHADLKPCAIPDPGQIYFAEITDKLTKEDRSLLMSLSQSGLVTGLRGNLPKGLENNVSSVNYSPNKEAKDIFGYSAETNLFEHVDTIIKMVTVDTVTVEKTYLDRKWVEKRKEKKAIEAANKIDKIRESRYNLLTGYQEIPYPSGTISYMDRELQKMEKEYLSLFTGVAMKKKFSYTIYIDPKLPEESQRVPVCIFSERSGVKDVDAAGGEKLFLEIKPTGDFSSVFEVMDNKNQSTGVEKGFFYRIPETVEVSFKISNDLKIESLVPVCQYGRVAFLSPAATSIQFHLRTGAVKTLFVE